MVGFVCCAGVAQPGLECQTLQATLIIWRSWVRNPPPALEHKPAKCRSRKQFVLWGIFWTTVQARRAGKAAVLAS